MEGSSHTPKRKVALVTGGTQGIGFELAKIFAKEGYDLYIVGRHPEKTAEVAARIAATFPVEVWPIAQDLTSEDAAERLYAHITAQGNMIDVLVNNAGFGILGDFATTQLDYEIGMMRVNMETVVRLTKAFLPHFIGAKQGKILNVASTAAFLPGPSMAVYFASKAFVLSFSEALTEELAAKNITVTALCPGPTKTGFQESANMATRGSDADPFVVALAAYRGLMKGKSVVIPGMRNSVLHFAARFMPRRMRARRAGAFLRTLTTTP